MQWQQKDSTRRLIKLGWILWVGRKVFKVYIKKLSVQILRLIKIESIFLFNKVFKELGANEFFYPKREEVTLESVWPDFTMKSIFFKSRPISNKSSYDFKCDTFTNCSKIIGYFCKKIWLQYLSKIAQSGHTHYNYNLKQ